MDESKYEAEIDLTKDNTSHLKSIELVGSDKRVVDFGCSTGFVARVLSDRGCTVTGIELDAEAAAKARAYCDRVIEADLDELDLAEALGGEKYDVGLFGDVIEHLKDPRRVLVAMRDLLAPGGYIVLSVPNVAHASVRLALLKGQFDYEDVGILDATHLRFYTRESIADLLESCGYLVDVMDWVEQKVSEDALHEVLDPLGLNNLDEVVKAFSEWEAVAYQFVIKAVPASEEAIVERLSEEKVQAQRKLRVLEKEVAEYKRVAEGLEQQIAGAREYQKNIEAAVEAKDTYIVQLENAVAESRRRLDSCEQQISEMAAMAEELESSQAPPKKRKWL
jgi:SAM-dependent methyltransferase